MRKKLAGMLLSAALVLTSLNGMAVSAAEQQTEIFETAETAETPESTAETETVSEESTESVAEAETETLAAKTADIECGFENALEIETEIKTEIATETDTQIETETETKTTPEIDLTAENTVAADGDLNSFNFKMTDVRDAAKTSVFNGADGIQAVIVFGAVETCTLTRKALSDFSKIADTSDRSKLNIYYFDIGRTTDEVILSYISDVSDEIMLCNAENDSSYRLFKNTCIAATVGYGATPIPLMLYKGTDGKVYKYTVGGGQPQSELEEYIETGRAKADSSTAYQTLNITGEADYEQAWQLLDLINEERAKDNRSALKMDKDLLDAAMLRAAECSLYYSHTRPDGMPNYMASYKIAWENTAIGQGSAKEVMEEWLKSDRDMKNGHFNLYHINLYKSVGVGCFYVNGTYKWVQFFGYNNADEAEKPEKAQKTYAIKALPQNASPYLAGDTGELKAGEKIQLEIRVQNDAYTTDINADSYRWESSDKEVAAVDSKGVIKAKKAGNATITGYNVSDGKQTLAYALTVTGTAPVNIPCSGKNKDISWSIDANGKLTVTGTGDYSATAPPWAEYCEEITSAEIKVTGMKSAYAMFRGCSSLASVDLRGFDSGILNDASSMFSGCTSLKDPDLSGLNTGKVTNMSRMFADCSSLQKLNLGTFNTGKVTDMAYMFAGCSSLTSLDLSGFDTAELTDIGDMFSYCASLRELDMSGMDLRNVPKQNGGYDIFYGCEKLEKIYTPRNLSLNIPFYGAGKWYQADGTAYAGLPVNTESSILITKGKAPQAVAAHITAAKKKVVYDNGEALNLDDLKVLYYAPDGTIKDVTDDINTKTNKSSIDMSSSGTKELLVTYKDGGKEFNAAGIRITVLAPVSGDIAAGSSENITWKIDGAGKLTVTGCGDYIGSDAPWYNYRLRIKTAEIKVSGMTFAAHLFEECQNMTSVDLSGFDTGDIEYMGRMFQDCTSLKELDLSRFKTDKVASMSLMFSGCSSLKELDLSSFNTSQVYDMSYMFSGCESLASLNLDSFNTENAEDMAGMFADCKSLASLSIDGLTTDKVTDMRYMFSGCSSLSALDISNFDTGKVENINGMFSGCSSLLQLDLENFELSNIKKPEYWTEPFKGCGKLAYISAPISCAFAIKLPGYGNNDKWYGKNGTAHSELPSGIELYKNGYPGDGKTKRIVQFDMQGHGTQVQPVETGINEKLEEPEAPAAEGFIFNGWYREKACKIPWDFAGMAIAADMTLYAKWSKNSAAKHDSLYAEKDRTDLKSVNAEITPVKAKVYDGNPYEPVLKVNVTENGKKKTLLEGTDYKVLYENNINSGNRCRAAVSGNGIYSGGTTIEFSIIPKNIKTLKVITGSMPAGAKTIPPVYVYDGDKLLARGVNYKLSYASNPASAGTKTAQVTITGIGNYTGSTSASIPVYEGKCINASNVSLAYAKMPYTGKTIKDNIPNVMVDGAELVINKDYKVQYQNNVNAGTAFVIVTGKGAYKGRVVKPFIITASGLSLTINPIAAKTYSGNPQKPPVTVASGGKKLAKNKDYEVYYAKNIHSGEAVVTVIGKGSYKGVQEKASFSINPQSISKAAVKGTKTNLMVTYNKRPLKEGIDYEVKYDAESGGKASATITGKGDFAGSVTKKVKAQ